jgi:sugar lactone lactonase YvrE
MKGVICWLWIGLLLLSAVSCSSQRQDATAKNLLRQPESAVRDDAGKRWLVSCKENGSIVAIYDDGFSKIWAKGSHSVRGLLIKNGILYGAANEGVVGWKLTDAKRTVCFSHPRMVFLNDIAADNQGRLYVSDTQANLIFRVILADEKVDILAERGLDAPNGLWFDADANRLLLVSFRAPSSIDAVDLETGVVSVMQDTDLSELDGIICDASGAMLVSSWSTGAVYRVAPGDTSPPTTIATGLLAPADFCLSAKGILAIPEMNANRLRLVPHATSDPAEPQ